MCVSPKIIIIYRVLKDLWESNLFLKLFVIYTSNLESRTSGHISECVWHPGMAGDYRLTPGGQKGQLYRTNETVQIVTRTASLGTI